LLVDSLDPGSAAYAEARQIKRAAEQAAELPQQLLAFGRKQTLQPVLVDLNEVVTATGRLLRHLVTEKIKLVTDIAARRAHASVDPSQVEHVLVNLALNARDAMPEGGTLTLTTRDIEVAPGLAREHDVAPGPYVSVAVTDTGAGMDEATKARIFEPFFTTKAPGAGSGLGLARVYGTVTQSGGFLQVISAPGAGTTIAIHFPCEATAPAPVREPGLDALGPAVLLAEDEDVVRDFAAAVLERAGYRVHAAADGAQALELYTQLSGRVNAVVTDLVMPGIGGRELRDRLLALDPSLPVVFMSGYADEPVEPDQGDDVTFLQKPFSPRSLVDAVHERLDTVAPADAITCVVADDHPAVLDAVTRFLESKDIRVTQAASGEEALQAIEGLKPAVAIVDASMSPLDGLDVTRRTATLSPGTRTVVYTGHHDSALLEEALDAGASGLVFKEAPLTELERALRIVAEGGTYVDPELAAAVTAAREALPSLTPRELQILGLVADGMTNEKVAESLSISPETVQSHVRNAMVKLGAESRTEAVATALRLSLIA
jgi:DNA-binding NarL/FixJ family response regulator